MSRFYVISPNVENAGNTDVYLKQMFAEHSTMMGWGPGNKYGQMFANMNLGDYVICAQGANDNKRLYYAGRVCSKSTLEWPFTRYLEGFVDLRTEGPLFSKGNAYGSANRIPAIYELKSDNPADYKLCMTIKSKVDEMINTEKIDNLVKLLESNKNLILTGAPGTGKTYLAKQIASKLCFNTDYSNGHEQEDSFKSRVGFVQFHPSYDYTDFVEGLRPKVNENGFWRIDGVFKKFCKDALIPSEEFIKNHLLGKEFCIDGFNCEISEFDGKNFKWRGTENKREGIYLDDQKIALESISTILSRCSEVSELDSVITNLNQETPTRYFKIAASTFCKDIIEAKKKQKHVFIIDEINRGELSKIFGELFFSIEPGYRGKKGCVETQYQNLVEPSDLFEKGFYVPENVYIIGTMNDIDRSVESMDFAMRRRFAFEEILAEKNTSMLDGIKEKDVVIARMTAINQVISSEEELGSSYHIGGAYFKNVELCRKEDNEIDWKLFWDRYLYRLVFEYVRGFQNKASLLEKMEDAIVIDKTAKDKPAQN